MPRRLTRNAVRCDTCGDTIESTHRHDFRYCTCQGVAVDGGLAYTKRSFSGPYTDLSTYETVPCGACGKAEDVDHCPCWAEQVARSRTEANERLKRTLEDSHDPAPTAPGNAES